MKLFIIPVRITDLPQYLSEKLLQKTSHLKVRTKDGKIFHFDSPDTRMQITSKILNFVIALNGYAAKDIDRFFFLNTSDELLYVSRPGIPMKNELEKIWIGEKL